MLAASGRTPDSRCVAYRFSRPACSFGPGSGPARHSRGRPGFWAGRRPKLWAGRRPGPISRADRRLGFWRVFFYLSLWLPYYQGTVLSSPQRPQRRSKGPIDMPLLQIIIFPRPGLVAVAAEKVEMGAEHPTLTPYLGVYSPPKHATLMSGLKQKQRGDCWLERGCAGVPTARLLRLPLRIV